MICAEWVTAAGRARCCSGCSIPTRLTLADLYSPDLATAIRNHFGTPPPSKPLRSPSEAPELGARSKEQGARQIGAGRNGVSERHTETTN